jgi:nucleotidyltransferase/DNA polymerase involved in DNA repair
MPISVAYNKCPEAVFLPPDMEKYDAASREILKIFETFTPDIEPISIDEAFLDITGSWHLFGSPEETCRLIKLKVKEKTRLAVSLGMAPTKTAAKIASDIGKPDGFVSVSREKLLSFLHPLSVKKLWGVGEKTEEELKKLGISTIGDLAVFPEEKLCRVLGTNGLYIKELARGMDPRNVSPPSDAASISNEFTFTEDTSDVSAIMDNLMILSEKVSRRMRKNKLKGRTVTLKIRFSDFKTYTRSLSSYPPTDMEDEIYKKATSLLEEFLTEKRTIRLLGVKMSNFEDTSVVTDLFQGTTQPEKKRGDIQKALDRILDKYGEGAIRRRK